MNKYARFDEIPSMTLKDIKESKHYGRTNRRTDKVKTVYPPTNTVCGGIKIDRAHKMPPDVIHEEKTGCALYPALGSLCI